MAKKTRSTQQEYVTQAEAIIAQAFDALCRIKCTMPQFLEVLDMVQFTLDMQREATSDDIRRREENGR